MTKLYIDFEGIDGSGKDTNLIEFANEIKEDGNNFLDGNKYSTVWITREPTRLTKSGKTIAQLIRERDVTAQEASKYFINDRIEHGNNFIRQIKKHSYVLSSRGSLSTQLYQTTQGMTFDELYKMHSFDKKDGAIIPDLTIVFDISVDEAFKRMNNRKSAIECFENRTFQEQLKKNIYLCINKFKEYDDRDFIIVNANQTREKVKKEMITKVNEWYHKK